MRPSGVQRGPGVLGGGSGHRLLGLGPTGAGTVLGRARCSAAREEHAVVCAIDA